MRTLLARHPWARKPPKLAAAITALIATLVLIGWTFDLEYLKRIFPGLVAMNPMTALAFLLAAVSLALFSDEKSHAPGLLGPWVARACAFTVAFIGVAKLAAIFGGPDVQIDRLLFSAKLSLGFRIPNVMAPNTAINFVLVGNALLLVHSKKRRMSLFAFIATLVCGFEALLAILGYAYGIPAFYVLQAFIPMALPTAVAFLVVVFGIMACQAKRGFLAILIGDSAGGTMARRLLPAAILVPAGLGWLWLKGQRAGLFEQEFGAALYSITNMLVFALLVACSAHFLFKTDIERTKAELRLRRAHDALEGHVQERTEQLSAANAELLKAHTELEARVRERTASLSHSEERYRLLFESNPYPVWVYDIETLSFLAVNEAAVHRYGYSQEEFLSMTIKDIRPTEDIPALLDDVATPSTDFVTADGWQHRKKDGTVIDVEVTSRPISFSGKGARLVLVNDITERKRSEDEVRRIQKFLDSIVENIPDMIFVKEAKELRFVRWNKAGEELLGHSRDELIGKNDYDMFSREQADIFMQQDRLVLESRRLLDIPEEKVETRDGERLLHTKKIPILNEKGEATYLLGVSTDITERKQADDTLQENKRQLEAALGANQLILDKSRDVICTIDEAGRFVTVSAACETLWGYKPVELIGKSYIEMVYTEDRAATNQVAAEIIAGSSVSDLENRYVRKDGSLLHVMWSAYWSKADRTMFAVAHDITARKHSEKALRQSEEQTRLIVETAGDAFIAIDSAGFITNWNSQAEITFGWQRAEALGRRLSETIIPPQHQQAHERGMKHFHATGEGPVLNKRIEITAIHRDGREFPIELAIWPIKNGETHTFNAFLRDITERKEAEETIHKAKKEAEQANRAKSEFLAQMSHEIRTPMNGIIGMTGVALNTELTTEQREYLTLVKSSADALLTVINDILDFSKIEAGKLDLDVIDFNLRDDLGDTMKSLSSRAAEKNLELACRFHPEVPDVLVGDAGRLRQIVVNLVGNAIKFTATGEVVLEVKVEGRAPASLGESVSRELSPPSSKDLQLHFSVSDTGVGIPAEKKGLIFDAFAQADTSTTREYGGTGLGLAISSRLVGLMGGRIWVESEPGEGSTFHFTASLGRGTKPLPSPALAKLPDLRGLPVLVVDDNATNRRILEETLIHWKMKPMLADGGPAALEMVRKAKQSGESVGLVLLDFHMPEMDGFAVAERLREVASAPILILTSGPQPGDRRRSQEIGIASWLTKPVKQSELLDAMLSALQISWGELEQPAGKFVSPFSAAYGSLRVLLVEDTKINQRLATILLEERGHSVQIASNGKQALAALDEHSFDLVLMDVQMPEMDGFEATARIRAQEKITGRHLPIIAMTAHALKGDRERCLASGMDDYVAKPIQPGELWRAIDAVCAAVPTTATPPTENFFPTRALQSVGGDLNRLRELAGIFLEETATLMPEIRAAVARGDAPAFRSGAHTLGGAVGIFGATAAVAAARELETIGRDGDLRNASHAFAVLENEIDQLKPALVRLSQEEDACCP